MEKLLKGSLAVMLIAGCASIASAQNIASNDVYKSKCAMCHGASGEGKAAMKTKPIKDYASLSDAELTSSITNGKGKMPGYKGKLTEAQIKSLVAAIKAQK